MRRARWGGLGGGFESRGRSGCSLREARGGSAGRLRVEGGRLFELIRRGMRIYRSVLVVLDQSSS